MTKRTYKLVSLIVTFAFLFSTISGLAPAYAATTYKTDTLIEAEDTTLGKGAITEKDKAASGGKRITTSGERLDDTSTIKNPDIAFDFEIPSDATYGIYAKVIIPSGGNDSYHYKIDGGEWQTVHPGETGADYVWLKLVDAALTAGKHTFYWNHRENGSFYDAFFITADASKLPKIEGSSSAATPTPAASATPAATPSSQQETGSQKLKQFKTTGGSAMFEAEDATFTKLVSEVKSGSASGKKALQLAVDDRVAPAADAKAGIGFEILADKSGSYSVWVRLVSTSGGTDSCWTSLNGAAYKDTGLGEDSKDADDYTWRKIGTISGKKDKTFTFRIIPRETGALMDKFIVTTNATYTPKDMGELPAEGDVSVLTFPEKYPKPSITPPPEHPRVMFRAQDIATIKQNMEHEESAAAVAKFNELKETAYDGKLEDKGNVANYDSTGLAIIESKAFDYVLNGNDQNGKEAIAAIKNYAETCTYVGIHDYTRQMGHVIFTAAEVYDWCYPLLTKEDKEQIVAVCHHIGSQMEIGFPPSGQGAVCGHGGEMQLLRDWLAFSIAVYDEYPDQYNFVGGRFFSEYTKTRNYWYTSESHHQGSAYGSSSRHEPELWSQWLIYRMSGETPYIPEMGKVAYQWIYTRRPDGQLLREGDDYNEGASKNKYWNTIPGVLFYAANFYKDPILNKEFMKASGTSSFAYGAWSRTPVQTLVFNDPTVGKEDVSTLPLTKYFNSPLGAMVARTGWNMGMKSPDVLAYMKIGEVWGANHNHRDAGNFQIYYKGILASESGFYESYGTDHDANYNKATIAHNTLLISSDTDEIGNQRKPGGGSEPATYEKWIESGDYVTGEVIGHEFGPDIQYPEYSYISGDIAKAYNSNVKEAVRSMLFMPLDDDEHPAAFVVFDRVETDKSGYKKTFMLHMQQEPSVDGNVSTIVNNVDGYNGKLTNQTLIPADANIEIIGGEGKEFWMGDRNYALKSPASQDSALEEGWGRIEISPKKTDKTDYFLNVMYVNDADKDLALEKAELIETEAFAGAKIFNRVAMFNKEKARTKDAVSFTVPGNDAELKVNVAGLEAGTWSIKVNGSEIGTQIASEDGGIIYFTAPAGSYELTYSGGSKNKEFTDSGAPEVEGITIMLNGNYLYSDVPPTIIDDRTLVPMRAIFEALNADVSWDEATATATAKAKVKKKDVEIKLTENQKTVYVNDEPVELDVPAMIINGRFVVPVRFVAETFGATVGWNAHAERVDITAKIASTKSWNFPNMIEAVMATQSGDDGNGNTIENSFDADLSTRWAPEGKDGAAWGIYDLGAVYTLDKIKLAYYNGNSRVYFFDIAVSEDGVNYTTVISGGESSGTTNELEDYDLGGVKARYVKYIGGGNSSNLWNSLTEIVFIEKK